MGPRARRGARLRGEGRGSLQPRVRPRPVLTHANPRHKVAQRGCVSDRLTPILYPISWPRGIVANFTEEETVLEWKGT